MRIVNVRNLQRNFYNEIKDLPFVIARRVKGSPHYPLAVMLAYQQYLDLVDASPKDVNELPETPTLEIVPLGGGRVQGSMFNRLWKRVVYSGS